MLQEVENGRSLTYVDLFAGCGGLSLGLEKAGFRGVLAVEKSPMAAETYYHNFLSRIGVREEWTEYEKQSLEEQVKRGLVVRELRALLDAPKRGDAAGGAGHRRSRWRSTLPRILHGGPTGPV